MIFSIEISNQAETDLKGIYEYIAFNLQSPENADRLLTRLEESIIGLDQIPERFREYESEPWCGRGFRIMPIDNYCVLYIPDEEKAVVTIIRVMYGSRDMKTQLKKYTSL